MAVRKRIVVTGTVQGVGFRWWLQAEAQRLGVSGWVRNRSDGAVEAELEGEEPAVDAVIDGVRQGSSGASVAAVTIDEVSTTGSNGFEITR